MMAVKGDYLKEEEEELVGEKREQVKETIGLWEILSSSGSQTEAAAARRPIVHLLHAG